MTKPTIWTERNRKTLKKFYLQYPTEAFAIRFKSTEASVRVMASRLGVAKKRIERKWTKEELELLWKAYQKRSFVEVAQRLSRPRAACVSRAHSLAKKYKDAHQT